MTPRIWELKVAAATPHRVLRVLGQAVRSLKGRVAANEDKANTAEAGACKTLGKWSQLCGPAEGLDRTVCGECAFVVGLIEADLVPVRSVITTALSESEGTAREEICHGCDGSLLRRLLIRPSHLLRDSLIKLRLGLLCCKTFSFAQLCANVIEF